MKGEQALVILEAAGRAAVATAGLFDALEAQGKGELSIDEAIEVAEDYCAAKEAFDSAVSSRGLVG